MWSEETDPELYYRHEENHDNIGQNVKITKLNMDEQ